MTKRSEAVENQIKELEKRYSRTCGRTKRADIQRQIDYLKRKELKA